MTEIQQILFSHQDTKYGDFVSKLTPNIPRESIIGIRSPEIKKIIKEIKKNIPQEKINDFLQALPHQYHEENILQVVFINGIKDFDECIIMLEKFLPFITNWAVSDGIGPGCFKADKYEIIIQKIKEWLQNNHPYTIRVAILLLKKYFLTESFSPDYLKLVAQIRSEDYYVNMMIAWFFAEALVKQWDSAIPFIQNKQLEKWTHNKAIQKARESFRIIPEQKDYLKTLSIKN